MVQQTAVDWLAKELWSLRLQLRGGEISIQDFGKQEIKLLEQAKQIEEEQIAESWNDGNFLGRNPNILADYDNGKKYFIETYKK